MDNAYNYFDAWHKTQESLFDGFIETTKRTQQFFLGQQNSVGSKGIGGFNAPYSYWNNAMLDFLSGVSTENKTIADGLSKMLGGSSAYLKLYEVWQPLLKALSEKSISPEAFHTLLAPAQYKELIDKVFGFDTETVKNLIEQASNLLELYTGYAQKFGQPWAEATGLNLGTLPQFAAGHPEAFLKIFHSLFKALDSTIGRAFHVPPVGKDREVVEVFLRGLDDLSIYAAKNLEYQHKIYTTGLVALEKVVESLADKVKTGEEIKQFDEFFDIWVDVNEQAYFQLFQTEEFALIQAEVLDAGLNVRKHFFKIMEMQLEDLPVVLRSEMDDLYKTVYELKKKVKKLEKQIKEESP